VAGSGERTEKKAPAIIPGLAANGLYLFMVWLFIVFGLAVRRVALIYRK
jgi:hypothetical protein